MKISKERIHTAAIDSDEMYNLKHQTTFLEILSVGVDMYTNGQDKEKDRLSDEYYSAIMQNIDKNNVLNAIELKACLDVIHYVQDQFNRESEIGFLFPLVYPDELVSPLTPMRKRK